MDHLTEKEKQALKELVEALKKLYGDNLVRVILYGSKARGDATKDSDIDIMVVLKNYEDWNEEFDKVFDIVYPINYEYNMLISVVIKKEEEYLTKKTPLLLNVRKEGVEI